MREAGKTQHVKGALWESRMAIRSSLYRFTLFGHVRMIW